MVAADRPEDADLVVVNTCAFIEAGPRGVDRHRSWPWPTSAGPGARLVVTGCLAERYGAELAEALPEVDAVAGFGVPVTLGPAGPRRRRRGRSTSPGSTC